MQKLIAVAILALAVTAGAQAPVTDTFTLAPTPTLGTPYYDGAYHSYYTWTLQTFDGATASGSEVQQLDNNLFDFTFPSVTLDGCTRTSETVTPLYRYGSLAVTYQTQYTTDIFACENSNSTTYSVVTTRTVHYKLVAGARGLPSFAVLLPYPPISGTVTAQ